MNLENLNALINKYEASLEMLNGTDHYELFKWKAMKTWQTEWNKPEDAFLCIADRLSSSMKDFSLLIDNSRMHPSSAIIKLAEKEPEKVKNLFTNVLFSENTETASEAQSRMDKFVEEMEQLREQYYPANWSYKIDRHTASVFLSMNAPAHHYIYKSGEAITMAKYIDYDLPIGTGANFSLFNYYKMCEDILNVIKEHQSLVEKHFKMLRNDHYYDDSLHLLVFDFIRCCRAYQFYIGIPAPKKEKAEKPRKTNSAATEASEQKRKEKEERRVLIETKISELELFCEECLEDISLIDVQVNSEQFGAGTVIAQTGNKITVRFGSIDKKYILSNKYPSHPQFENEHELMKFFTDYEEAKNQIRQLKEQLSMI